MTLRTAPTVVYVVAVAGKLVRRRGRRDLRLMLAGVGVPRRLAGHVAAALVVAEVAIAATAPWPATGLASCVFATLLMVPLTVGLARAVRRGTTASCRCFGSSGGRLGWTHVARDATLTAVATAAAVAAATARNQPTGIGLTVAMVAGAVCALAVVFWEDLYAVLRPSIPLWGDRQ